MEEQHIKVEKKELVIVASLMVGIFMLMVLTSLRDARTRQKSQAQTPLEIGVQTLSPLSEMELSSKSASIDLRSNTENGNQVLYDAQATGEGAVLEFMDKNPLIDATALSNNVQVQGATTERSKQRVLPENFRKTAILSRQNTDKMFKDRRQIRHYYYTQKIKNIPVFGAQVRFDLEGEDKIVGVDGEYTLSETITEAKLTDEEAKEIARQKADEQIKKLDSQKNAVICSGTTSSRQIINQKMLGIGENDDNRLAYVVSYCNSSTEPAFYHIYNIALDNGEVLSDGDGIVSALNRTVYNCKTGSCPVGRSEGGAATGDSDVDTSYEILGDVYNYFFSTFNRDSYDGRGAPIKAKVHFPGTSQLKCPNAFWHPAYNMMYACNGLVAKDVWGHELMHGVTTYTSNLNPQGNLPQAGALNESISDMFAYAVDPDWTLGEDIGRIIRNMQDPRLSRQPDRIFASSFSCNGEVHDNAGPTNKAFYLMVAGGTFNGCTMNGVGAEKALAIIYKANTVYLRSSSGFFDFNNKVNQACGELYGASSSECANVKAALQATELDQDRCGSGVSRSTPVCAGGTQPTVGQTQPTTGQTQPTAGTQATVAPTVPQGGANANPTVPATAPTSGTSTSQSTGPSLQLNPSTPSAEVGDTVKLDLVVNSGLEMIVSADALLNYDEDMLELVDIIDGNFLGIKTKDASRAGFITVGSIVRDTSNPITGSGILGQLVFKVKGNGVTKVAFTCVPGVTTDSNILKKTSPATDIIQCSNNVPATITVGKGLTLDLALHFQGIDRAFGRNGGSIPIQVGLVGENLAQPLSQLIQFSANASGVVRGAATFPTAPAGNYCVYIKGPLHSRRKVCHVKPIEAQTGEYRRGNSSIPLTNGTNELDFTGISMMSGDIDQNGVVNSFDLLSVRNAIGDEGRVEKDRCDVNFDNECNAIDYALIVAAILIKTDE